MAADGVLRDLAGACPAARAADAGDAVAGVVPSYAASPASVDEAAALLRGAAAHGLTVVARGGGSKLDWGAPPRRCDLVVDTLRLDRVLEHAAGDLVTRVQAGVRLDRLAEVLAQAGQQLALDPPPAGPGSAAGQDRSTVGGALATGAAGPRRLRYGTPRDLIIGITVVRADGTVARSGGKVVKNVAGYDLGKLFAGSYGTLGLIVDATFRLHPVPAGVEYVLLECDGGAAAQQVVTAAVASELTPTAIEIERIARHHPVQVATLLEGDPAGVSERAGQLREVLGRGSRTSPSAPDWWGWPAGQDGALTGTLVRVAFWPAALARILAVIDAAAAAAGLNPPVGGSAAAGVIYTAFAADLDAAAVAAFITGLRDALARGEGDARPEGTEPGDLPPALGSALVMHAPPKVRDLVDLWGPVPSLGLMRAVKDQFDPEHLMAPGRFAGGL